MTYTCRWCGLVFIGGTGAFDSAVRRWSDHTWIHADEIGIGTT